MNRWHLLALAALLGGVGSAQTPYVVRPGDTLYSVARSAKTTVAALQELNHLTSVSLRVGQTLLLPSAVAAPAPPAALSVGGVSIGVPAHLRMGDAFVLRLSGTRAAEAVVQFPSEVGEDVGQPNERLTRQRCRVSRAA